MKRIRISSAKCSVLLFALITTSLSLAEAQASVGAKTETQSSKVRQQGKPLANNVSAQKALVCADIVAGGSSIPLDQLNRDATKKTKEIAERYSAISEKVEWASWIGNDLDYLTYASKSSIERGREKGIHPTEVYGFAFYKNWMRAQDYLNRIPLGEFVPNIGLISELHKIVAEDLTKVAKFFDPLIADGFIMDSVGVKKRRMNFGGDPLINPLTEEQFQALKTNKWLDGFTELPWPFSREGSRRGIIRYSSSKTVVEKLSRLFSWYRENEKIMDPVELAAKFQYGFISIHPFVDGNGRTSLLLMNRILKEKGLPPALRTETGFDIYFSEEQWVEAVRQSTADYVDLALQIFPKMKDKEKEIPSVFGSNYSDTPRTAFLPESARSQESNSILSRMRSRLARAFKWMNSTLSSANGEMTVRIGKGRYRFLPDGFFYNQKGVPHALAKESQSGNLQLYPIADRTYFLYAENGNFVQRRFWSRSFSKPVASVWKTHVDFLQGIEDGSVDPKLVREVPYKTVEQYNNDGQIFLFPWQKQAFANAIEIKETEPVAVLATVRGGMSDYERAVFAGSSISGATVLAQYITQDMKFDDYARFAAKVKNQSWIETIEKSREKTFNAAKTLLADIFASYDKLAEKDKAYVSQHPKWKLFLEYLAVTPLQYASYEEAVAHRDGTVVLLRSDNSIPKYVGFHTNEFYVQLFGKIPGVKSLMAKLSEVKREESDPTFITELIRKYVPIVWSEAPRLADVMLAHPLNQRGSDAEFQREFVDQYLHAVNTPLKTAISLSNSTDLYIRSKDVDGKTTPILPFTTDGNGTLYFVKVKMSEATPSVANKYLHQFEILATQALGRGSIVKKLEMDFFNLPSETPSKEVENFFANGNKVNTRVSKTEAELSEEAKAQIRAATQNADELPEVVFDYLEKAMRKTDLKNEAFVTKAKQQAMLEWTKIRMTDANYTASIKEAIKTANANSRDEKEDERRLKVKAAIELAQVPFAKKAAREAVKSLTPEAN